MHDAKQLCFKQSCNVLNIEKGCVGDDACETNVAQPVSPTPPASEPFDEGGVREMREVVGSSVSNAEQIVAITNS